MLKKGVTLRGLEVFEALASTGSVAQAAALTGLSQPAVSQQISNLEKALGSALVDHGKRPMRLTPIGQSFEARTSHALELLRAAQSELTVMDLAHVETLHIGMIDDFDNELTPRLATILGESLSHSRLKLITAASFDLAEQLESGALHLAILAAGGSVPGGITEYPLIRDPFVLVQPRGTNGTDTASLHALPLLRYTGEQLIGQQIEAHIDAAGLRFERRFEISSHQALMAMVARGIGWTITTPLGVMRAARLLDDVVVRPLPFGTLARRISLFAAQDWTDNVPRDVAGAVRRLGQRHMIGPALQRLPWLSGQFGLIDAEPGDEGV